LSSPFRFDVASHGSTTATIYRAADPRGVTLLLAHGAGAPQSHPFLVDMAARLAARGVDVVTFNFLYSERGRRMPDRSDLLEACWHAAIAAVRARGGLPTARLFCGGKSMGGRILSNIAASAAGEGLSVSGLVFLGYPLHPANKPAVRRDEHLGRVPFPMLFVQGARDALGDEAEMRELVRRLPRATLHVVRGGDHSLAIRARDGGPARQEEALDAAAAAVADFLGRDGP
jgi:predicted alpha/beta-hydrolase family hydrolase